MVFRKEDAGNKLIEEYGKNLEIAKRKAIQDLNKWKKMIDNVETLLIFAHSPVYNTSKKGPLKNPQLEDVHIYNWDDYMGMLPEVSGKRWTEKYAEFDGIWKPFGEA